MNFLDKNRQQYDLRRNQTCLKIDGKFVIFR